jgi:AcrR family transcriptional regulator
MADDQTAKETRRRPGGRSARVRSAVLKATLDELAESDYASLSLEAVARRAGVNKTSVYRRWGTRENLVLEAMLERGAEQVPIPDTGSLERDLVLYGTAIAAGVRAPEVQAIVRTVASIHDPRSPIVDASRRFWKTRYRMASEMVERAIARGEVPEGTDPRVVVESVVAPIYFRLLMSRQSVGPKFIEDLARFAARAARAPAD